MEMIVKWAKKSEFLAFEFDPELIMGSTGSLQNQAILADLLLSILRTRRSATKGRKVDV